jgi:phosphoserine phosphatase
MMWTNNEFRNLTEWTEYCLDNFREHELTELQFNQVLDESEYNQGVMETFKELRKKYVTVLISGGFKNQSDRVQRDLRFNHAVSACELFWNTDGTLDH